MHEIRIFDNIIYANLFIYCIFYHGKNIGANPNFLSSRISYDTSTISCKPFNLRKYIEIENKYKYGETIFNMYVSINVTKDIFVLLFC